MEQTMEQAMVRPILPALGAAESCLDDVTLRSQLEAHHVESYGWALSCCAHRRDEAENVLQIAYVKVLARRAVFDGRSTFKTWLFSVIRRTAAGERRTELLHRLRLREFFGGTPEPRHELTTTGDLKRLLGRLPARQREVLQLVFYHDLTVQEAAKVMGVSIGSARTHYERGKRRMRGYLEAGGKS